MCEWMVNWLVGNDVSYYWWCFKKLEVENIESSESNLVKEGELWRLQWLMYANNVILVVENEDMLSDGDSFCWSVW